MTAACFNEWFLHWDGKLIKESRRIALLLENTTCHPTTELSNIKLVFLPPNTTSHTQPMDQGIIANFKRHYRFHYTMKFLCPVAESEKKQYWAIRHPPKSSQTSLGFFCKTKIMTY